MLINLQSALVFSLLLCLASAFSTQFLIEGVDEVAKKPVAETKTKKMEKNDSDEKLDKIEGIEVEVVPIVTDVFTQAEDLFNMTPLKLVAAISTQHLLTTVKNIPVAGNSYEDSLNMLEGIVNEFNKTAQIIKLTAKYVNISGHYILSTLKEFAKQSCKVKSLDEAMKSVRMNFLKTITDHAVGAIKELNEKTRHREMTGSDILISSSYHIVSAFQEMTNQVLTLAEESKKNCKEPLPSIVITPSSGEKNNVSEQKMQDIFSFQVIPQQGSKHKSIKKDQAQLKTNNKATQKIFEKLQDQTLENFNNQDFTVDLFSPETIIKANNAQLPNQKDKVNEFKVLPENLGVEFSTQKMFLVQNPKTEKLNETPQGNVNQNMPTITKFGKFQDPTGRSFKNQDLTVEIFSPGTILKAKNSPNQESEGNRLKVPEELKMEYSPFKSIPVSNSKKGLLTEKRNQKPVANTFKLYQDQARENINNQDLTVEVFSPETGIFKSNNKGQFLNTKGGVNYLEGSKGLTNENISLKKMPIFQSTNNELLTETSKEKTSTVSKTTVGELDSSAVDSLSNVPWSSSESGPEIKAEITEKPSIHRRMNIFDLFKVPYQNGNIKQTQCDERLEPVCGFDENNNKFIIFLNDCKRNEHNRMYQTNYSSVNMEICVSLFLRSPAQETKSVRPPDAVQSSVDLRPR